jgi:hypothetical protein
MSMNLRLAFSVTFSLAAPAAFAQAQDAPAVDPVLAHFREFRAALDRGDAAAAEAAAQLAYDASEAVNGQRTAVLAINLATLRLDLGKPTAAYAPAQRAHELATANQDSGVDPLVAALVLGRAELAVDGASGAERLREAIGQAERRGDLQNEAYPAAVELARTAFALEQYALAGEAWAASDRVAAGSPSDPAFARGLARTGEGAAIFMQATAESGRGPSTRPAVIARGAARDANAALADALSLLQPFADGGDEGVLTLAQSAYAHALAWQGILRAKMQSQGDELPRAAGEETPPGAAARCAVRLVAEPPPAYPNDALLASGVGAVVIRARTDAQGAIVEHQIAAAIPAGSFSEAVAAVADQWRVEVAPDAAPGCRLDGTQYTPILFVAE